MTRFSIANCQLSISGVYLDMRLARIAVATLLAVLASSVVPAAQGERTRITTASSVRLRASPSEQASIVATLPLGTELLEQPSGRRSLSETLDSDNRAWVRVKAAVAEGWVLTGLTRPVTAGDRLDVIGDIVRRRLARDDGFPIRVELLDFIEREQRRTSDRETSATLSLYRLKAIQAVLLTIGGGFGPHLTTREQTNGRRAAPVADGEWQQIKAWLAARQDLTFFDEPGDRWILRHGAILQEHDRHRGSTAADDLAWLAATNGLGGECEGDIECYLTSEDLLLGEYLRRQPRGQHVDSAVLRITKAASLYRRIVEQPASFDPAKDCARIKRPVASLRAAVVATDSPARDEALAELDDLGHRCAGG
jgi:hypothetical protein